MSPEAWIAAVLAVVAGVLWVRAGTKADWALDNWKRTCAILDEVRAERDEALRQKASQFEAWQSESTNLRADVAALERENAEAQRQIAELRDGQWQAFTALNKAQRELALLRPIADAAAALCDGKNLPGEFTALREAIRARKEAGNG